LSCRRKNFGQVKNRVHPNSLGRLSKKFVIGSKLFVSDAFALIARRGGADFYFARFPPWKPQSRVAV
jgi:hypothetical protein